MPSSEASALSPIANRLLSAFLPLLLTPALGFLLAEGALDLGGGDKDLLWVLPFALWSLVYAVSSLILWSRGAALGPSVRRSAGVATLALLLVALALALVGQLGVGGRF